MAGQSNTKQAALITGAAKRLGAAQALSLAEIGFDIAIHYNTSEKEAIELQKEIAAKGVECEIFQADLRDAEQVKFLIKDVIEAFPHLSLLVNNASLFQQADFMATGEGVFDDHIAINLKAPFLLTRGFAKVIGKGQVINILDAGVHKYDLSHFIYLITKKALTEFTYMAAKELAPEVRINGVAPGITDITYDATEAYLEQCKDTLPMRKLTTATDVSIAVQQLAQMQNITGQIIYVDGGERFV